MQKQKYYSRVSRGVVYGKVSFNIVFTIDKDIGGHSNNKHIQKNLFYFGLSIGFKNIYLHQLSLSLCVY